MKTQFVVEHQPFPEMKAKATWHPSRLFEDVTVLAGTLLAIVLFIAGVAQ